jgi:urease accessory protein
MTLAVLLTLADARLPAGGHAHSGGVEQAIADGLVRDETGLAAFLTRRLRTAGRVAAGLAAATAADDVDLAALDAEADARMPSPAQRAASRAQGRGLLRVARRAWPAAGWLAAGRSPHHAVVLGLAARAGGLGPAEAALVSAYLSVTGPASAAQRLLGLDPVSVAVITLRLADEVGLVAAACAEPGSLPDLPDDADPLLDLLAERHAPRKDKLFAS